MASELTAYDPFTCTWEERIEYWTQKYPLSTPAACGYGRKIQRIVAEHLSKQKGRNVVERQDSAARITKPDAKPKRASTLSIRNQANPTVERSLKKEMDPRERNGLLPVKVQIEHCYFQRTPNQQTRMGKVIGQTSLSTKVGTFHSPPFGFNATSYSDFCESIRQVYNFGFGAFHYRHQHPSEQNGDIIMELYCRAPDAMGTERLVTQENWQHILQILNVAHPRSMRMSGCEAYLQYFVARFTCGVVS